MSGWNVVRSWGRSGFSTSALGLGGWAIAGQWQDLDGNPLGWGETDEDESIAAIRRALDLGVTFFDTADAYGAGNGERVLGLGLAPVLSGRRDTVVVASKWGNTFDEKSRTLTGGNATPEYLREALLGSLRRLGTDYLDLYQLHLSGASLTEGERLRDACEELVTEGLIRGYAWSTDDPERATVFAAGRHCAAVQHELSVLHDAADMLELCAKGNLASINRSPLAMGLLSGKYQRSSRLAPGDIRATPPQWLRFFSNGGVSPVWFNRTEAIRAVLCSNGRTPAQGALGWLWARSDHTVPIPGFRTVAQVEENVAALRHGPLTAEQMSQIDGLLNDVALP